MPRLVARTTALIRRFVGERRGAIAVEFAIIGIPMLMLMFGVLELALILLVTATLDSATDFAARKIRTGQFQADFPSQTQANKEISMQEFGRLVCRNMNWLRTNCDGKLIVDAETFDTFASAGSSEPAAPQDFDKRRICWSPGNPEDIVLVRTYYEWPIISPLLRPIFKSAGHEGRLLSSARIFRNEPYNAALLPGGAGC
ncbi:MAG: TadE/TadG family type IV pilus assembly protein [Pseudomonadota bacterium]|uniref:TadE/TadG family type IV pilus assembly protein n=1 Tax=Phenylobacterium sp. TaxID=1871053 RepID=UPI00272146BB|nr:TadE/TadG family type IV pilus assembly protein [Phenylobacterium sp.]MDO9430090.1 pilus assembly protein [Phenylobacterium sp.]